MLVRRLAGLIWAAILVVAVQAVPGTAFAHSGHAHHSSIAAAAAAAAAAAPAGPAGAAQAALRGVDRERSAHPALASAPPQDETSTAPTGGCSGGCCGGGVGCCGAVLVGPVPPLSLPRAGAEIFPLSFDERAGIQPDALARPPKILA
ncbi:MAG TPA: hypothetical protein VGF60_19755 [Xanthobacteraceae bacterium]